VSRRAAAPFRSIALLLAGLLLAILGAAVATARQDAPTPSHAPSTLTAAPADGADMGPLVATGPPPDLALIYTGGVVGYVEPCG